MFFMPNFFQLKKMAFFFFKNFITCKMIKYRIEYNEKWILTPNPGLHLLLLLPKAMTVYLISYMS